MGKSLALKPRMPWIVRRTFPDVTSVIDADVPVEITVTPRDCGKAAKPGAPTECALARAVKREYDADGAIVGLTTSYIIDGKRALRFSTGTQVARELVSFDRHADFAPGVYTLRPHKKNGRLGTRNWQKRPRGRNNGSRRSAMRQHKTVRVRSLVSAS